MKRGIFLSVFVVMALAAVACGSDDGGSDPTAVGTTGLPVATSTPTVDPADLRMLEPGDEPRTPVGALDTSKSYTATIKTEKGDIVIELFDDIASVYVENFINLARIGYYDDTTFHRVIADFMAQGGDPTGTGSGGPGYRFRDQFHPDMRHTAGVISMANAGPDTNGSQFFITVVETPHLDPYDSAGNPKQCGGRDLAGRPISCHAVFGKVVEGMDVVESIRLRNPQTDVEPGDKIITIEIEES